MAVFSVREHKLQMDFRWEAEIQKAVEMAVLKGKGIYHDGFLLGGGMKSGKV